MSNFTIVEADYNNPLASVITDYSAAERFEADKWGEAVRLTMDPDTGLVMSAEEWKDYYAAAEREQADVRMAAGEDIPMTKAGKIIASKAFPKTWNTDKAIIGKALTEGLDLFDEDGNPKAKSALQNEYKEVPKEEKSAFDKIITTINTYNALYGQLTDEEKEVARIAIGAVHTAE